MCDITGDGIVYDRSADIPVIKSFISFAQCAVHIRPDSAWEGKEFGFDWIRINDSGIRGDAPYHQNVGRYKNQTDENSTSSGTFEQQPAIFERLIKDYFPDDKRMLWKWESPHGDNDQSRLNKEARFRYYIPVMTLLNGKEAKLGLKIEMDTTKTAPDRIELSTSDSEAFALSLTEIPNPANNSPHDLTITCRREIEEEQHLLLHAVYTNSSGEEQKSICGMLRILPNIRRRRLKVLFVELEFTISSGDVISGSTNPDHIAYARRLLKQAMVDLDDSTITYIVPNTLVTYHGNTPVNTEHPLRKKLRSCFNGTTFTSDSGIWGLVFNQYGIYGHIQKQGLLEKYIDHIVVVMLGAINVVTEGENPGATQASAPINFHDPKTRNLTSTFTPNGGGFILMYNPQSHETLVHEILHAVGLRHSFANTSPYTYRGLRTNNIMDYSHNARPQIPRIATWHWQWRILWDYIDHISQLESIRFKATIDALNGGIASPEENFDHLFDELREKIRKQKMDELEREAERTMPSQMERITQDIEKQIEEKLAKDKNFKKLKQAIDNFNKK